MIKIIFRSIFLGIKKVLSLIPKQIYRRVFAFIGTFALFIFSYSLLAQYLAVFDGSRSLENGDYSSAVAKFEMRPLFFQLEDWKPYFDSGVAYYQADLQVLARENFDNAKDKLRNSDNSYLLCMVDTNIAFSYERSAHITEKSAASAQDMRDAANYYLSAYLARKEITTRCSILGADALKTNDDQMANDQSTFQELSEKAFAIDGQKANEDIQLDLQNEFEKRQAEATENASENVVQDEKAQQLIDDGNKAQQDYQNAQDIKESSETDKKVVKPW